MPKDTNFKYGTPAHQENARLRFESLMGPVLQKLTVTEPDRPNFLELQVGEKCGRHALNNILAASNFRDADPELGDMEDKNSSRWLAGGVDVLKPDRTNWTMWAVANAAKLFGLQAQVFSVAEAPELQQLRDSAGIVFHCPGHFVALQWGADGSAIYMDSIGPLVRKLEPDELGDHDIYSIMLALILPPNGAQGVVLGPGQFKRVDITTGKKIKDDFKLR